MYKDHWLKLTYVIFGPVLFNIFNYDSDKVIDDVKQHGDLIYQMMKSVFRIDWQAFCTGRRIINRSNLGPQTHCSNLRWIAYGWRATYVRKKYGWKYSLRSKHNDGSVLLHATHTAHYGVFETWYHLLVVTQINYSVSRGRDWSSEENLVFV